MVVKEPKIDLKKAIVVSAELFDNGYNYMWRNVSVADLQKALETYSNVVIYDFTAKRKTILPAFFLEDLIGNVDDEAYKVVHIPYDPDDETTDWEFDAYTTNLLQRFHYSWYNLLNDVLYGNEFKTTMRQIKLQRETTPIFPKAEDVFVSFLTDIKQVKGIWVGMSPYPNFHANGIPFSTYYTEKPPSLKILEKGIRDACELGFLWNLDNNLISLRRKGVLLLNAALTTTSDPKSHISLWWSFTREVLYRINNLYPDIPIVLFGEQAKSFKPVLKSKNVFQLHHPAYYARTNAAPEYKDLKTFFDILNIDLNDSGTSN